MLNQIIGEDIGVADDLRPRYKLDTLAQLFAVPSAPFSHWEGEVHYIRSNRFNAQFSGQEVKLLPLADCKNSSGFPATVSEWGTISTHWKITGADSVNPLPTPYTEGYFLQVYNSTLRWAATYPFSGAVLRRQNGQVEFYANPDNAVSAASAYDSIDLFGRLPGINITKSLIINATGCVFTDTNPGAGVGFGYTGGGIEIDWTGGTFMGRIAVCRNIDSTTHNKITIRNVECTGPNAFVQVYGLRTYGTDRGECTIMDSRIRQIIPIQRSDSDHQMAVYFLRCELGTNLTSGFILDGLIHPDSLFTFRDCTVKATTGVTWDRTYNVNNVPISCHFQADNVVSRVLFSSIWTNLVLNGWHVLTSANPFTFPPAPESR